MPKNTFRIHPAIGVSRVGNSEEFYLAPEDAAGTGVGKKTVPSGGLPIRAGTEKTPITSADLRDSSGAFRRQAARFRIYCYPESSNEAYPNGGGTEIKVGSKVGKKTVKDIVWTVHVANKKANTFVLVEDPTQAQGISGYENGDLPPIRNTEIENPSAPQPKNKIATLNSPERVTRLSIDPGPRTILATSSGSKEFDKTTKACVFDQRTKKVKDLPNYPKSFPDDQFSELDEPAGPIDTLGSVQTDEEGRLLVLGGYGKGVSWRINGNEALLENDVNNDQWFDDTSDGPVSAFLVFDDDSTAEVHSAWVTTTDPSYAPQILNTVSIWDDIYDVWVRRMELAPEIYTGDSFNSDYKPWFETEVRPIFIAAAMAKWTTNLNAHAQSAHENLLRISDQSDPTATPLAGISSVFRNPNKDQFQNTSLMPLALGDANQSMLAQRKTQYFFLEQWGRGLDGFRPGNGPELGPGEALDKATLVNCLGGRFSPGIDLTFVVRQPNLYVKNWRASGCGPFRVRLKSLDYGKASPDHPLLTAGYIPLHDDKKGLEPGDLSKWMAVPWHTDYNSCATHLPSPNPEGNTTLFWSWPAQRPVAIFSAEDVVNPSYDVNNPKSQDDPKKPQPRLGSQRWSVRGEGTDSSDPAQWGRFQTPIIQMVQNWHRIGVVLQANAIDSKIDFDPSWYLEAASQLVDTGKTPVVPFPNIANPPWDNPEYAPYFNDTKPNERELFYQLMNVENFPEVLPRARNYVDSWLKWSEDYSNDPNSPIDQQFFEYTPEAFQERLDFSYQEFVDNANQSDPGNDPVFKTRDDVVQRIVQLAPFDLLDGAWLRNVDRTGPVDQVRNLLMSILMDELGDGDVSKNHCNIYQDLCHSVGYYPKPTKSLEFANDPQFLDSAFTVPTFELAISQFSENYYPEIIGMTLQLEWSVVELKPTRDLLNYFGIDSHFYVMHIGIDNAVNGHGQRAAESIGIYLSNVRQNGGDAAAAKAWRRIWNGYVAFGNIGTFGQDLQDLIQNKPTLRSQVVDMIKRKAKYGQSNHGENMIGASRINEWFNDPEGFADALVSHGWLTPGDWQNSRMRGLLEFETGPMYRVFTDEEIKLWANYTQSLAAPAPPPPTKKLSPAKAMERVIEQMRPIQKGNSGHSSATMADPLGKSHSVAWWFDNCSARQIMEALSSPENGLIVPNDPCLLYTSPSPRD